MSGGKPQRLAFGQHKFLSAGEIPEQAFSACDQENLIGGKTPGSGMEKLMVPTYGIGV
jgi:hypothetical protein